MKTIGSLTKIIRINFPEEPREGPVGYKGTLMELIVP
jgi:hypothetical protein